MKQADFNQKTHQPSVNATDQSTSAGPNGVAIEPPAHRVDVGHTSDLSKSRVLQTKLTINQPGDIYEREADWIAAQLMISPPHFPGARTLPQIQRFSGPPAAQAKVVPPSIGQALAKPGRPLEPALREDMERRFAHDFSQVRVHTGSMAEQSARDVHAHAYTVGHNIVFGTGQFAPHTARGGQVLAHELTHVVQQGGGIAHEKPVERLQRFPDFDIDDLKVVGATVIGGPSLGVSVALGQSSDVLDTIAGGLMGEFNEDPDFAMIGVDLGVSLIPILDQASDIRDIIAHLYYMIAKKQYDRFMRWLGLGFTLIGVFPEAGSLIKGASKLIIKGAREVISHLDELLKFIRKILPELGDLRRLQNYIAKNWNKWEAIGKSAWNLALDRVSVILSAARFTIGGVMGQAQAVLAKIRKKAQDLLPIAFNWMKHKIDNVLDEVVQHPSKSPAAPGLGETMIKEEKRTGLNVDVAAQEHRHKKDFREGSGKNVQSAHMVNSSSVSDISDYVRDSALTVLLPKDLHKAFDDYWKNWARNRLAKAKPGDEVKVTVAEWEKVLNDAADSVVGLKGRTADTMSFMIRTELYQTLGLKPDQLIRLPFSK